jgi:hypothetical protein
VPLRLRLWRRRRVQLRLHRRRLYLRVRLNRSPSRPLVAAAPPACRGGPMGEPTMCMPLEQCRELLVELQQLRLRITALEQVVANAVQQGEAAQQSGTEVVR